MKNIIKELEKRIIIEERLLKGGMLSLSDKINDLKELVDNNDYNTTNFYYLEDYTTDYILNKVQYLREIKASWLTYKKSLSIIKDEIAKSILNDRKEVLEKLSTHSENSVTNDVTYTNTVTYNLK